ncbi:MAG: GNAT family N-acetyltransferase [Bacteroidota bacterium]
MIITQISANEAWPIRQKVMWPDQSIDYVKIPGDEQATHYGLLVKSTLVSIVSLFHENNKIQFRKFATLTTEQGKGYGSYLLSEVLKKNATEDTTSIWCNARIDKIAFYEKFGLNPTQKTFNKGGLEYVIMKKDLT